MISTGIVRRVDDLGRIVIPKEIRENLRIRLGEPLELFSGENGEVIFKKYTPISKIATTAASVVASFGLATRAGLVVCDRDSYIAIANVDADLLGAETSKDIENLISLRRFYERDSSSLESFYLDKDSAVVLFSTPIMDKGDVTGLVLLAGYGKGLSADKSDIAIARAVADYIEKQISR